MSQTKVGELVRRLHEAQQRATNIPQVVAIVQVAGNGQVSLKKIAREHLDGGARTFYLDYLQVGQEILLTTRPPADGEPVEVTRTRFRLPEQVLAKLELEQGAWVAMIQRENALALKRIEIEQRKGDRARLVDVETTHVVKRIAYTNPMPEDLLPKLRASYSNLTLKHDVRGFLRGRKTLEAWKARELLGAAQDDDGLLREELIRERLGRQGEDGSWEGDTVLTARHLRELFELGMAGKDAEVQRAVDWLMDKPQSAYNPGMFFATDELVEGQASIIKARKAGKGGRFREVKTSEKKRVMAGDDAILAPCGPRIMWPNALVMEALLCLGYERHQRVQKALRFMVTHDWCECDYQHGSSGWRGAEPMTMEAIAAFEAECIGQYRCGGLRGSRDLQDADLAHRSHTLRTAHASTAHGDEYTLRMPDHIQGCEFITTRAMRRVQDEKMRRFAEAHLWRFAGIQHTPNGEFPKERHGTGFGQAGILRLFAGYNHPVSKVVITRSLPWIVDAQNEDGSWGEEPRVDATTLAVLEALSSLGDNLPAGLRP